MRVLSLFYGNCVKGVKPFSHWGVIPPMCNIPLWVAQGWHTIHNWNSRGIHLQWSATFEKYPSEKLLYTGLTTIIEHWPEIHFFMYKNCAFQAQAGVFLFFWGFEADMLLWLYSLVDHKEEDALLFHPDRFYCILQIFSIQKWKKI